MTRRRFFAPLLLLLAAASVLNGCENEKSNSGGNGRTGDIIIGQVATTMVAAHTIAPRNGLKIQREEPIRPTMKSTASTPRVMSCAVSAFVM